VSSTSHVEASGAKVAETAGAARRQCICQEEPGAKPCACTPVVTREQVTRLQTYTALQQERATFFSDEVGEWLSVLHADLLKIAEAAEADDMPSSVDVQHSRDLGQLLDKLGAPSAATLFR
jgi:hypothetical protein